MKKLIIIIPIILLALANVQKTQAGPSIEVKDVTTDEDTGGTNTECIDACLDEYDDCVAEANEKFTTANKRYSDSGGSKALASFNTRMREAVAAQLQTGLNTCTTSFSACMRGCTGGDEK